MIQRKRRPQRACRSLAALLPMSIATTGCLTTEQPVSRAGWPWLADRVLERPDLRTAVYRVLVQARRVAGTPIVRRVYRYADVGKHRTHLDARARYLQGQPRQEWFALAMSDVSAAGIISYELPLLAFAYRCTGDDLYGARIVSQLREVATCSPLQRPGWSLYAPSADPVPAAFQDGSWLATGMGVRAITDTLELMPRESLNRKLVAKLHLLLRREVRDIVEDWKLGRGWFRRGEGRPQTNQWVLPTEGLIRASLVLGTDRYRREYELGVHNLMRAPDIQGSHGEFNEGIGYAMMTVTSMLSAARAMAARGDRRAMEHPFLRGFPLWAVEHLQPGRFRINAFDSGGAAALRVLPGTGTTGRLA